MHYECPYCKYRITDIVRLNVRHDYPCGKCGHYTISQFTLVKMHIDDLVDYWNSCAGDEHVHIDDKILIIKSKLKDTRDELYKTKISNIVKIQQLNVRIQELENELRNLETKKTQPKD